MDMFLTIHLPNPFNFICFKSSLHFFFALDVANARLRVGLRNKVGHLVHRPKRLYRFPCWVPAEHKKAPKHTLFGMTVNLLVTRRIVSTLYFFKHCWMHHDWRTRLKMLLISCKFVSANIEIMFVTDCFDLVVFAVDCVQTYEPAVYLWFVDLYFLLISNNCGSGIRPAVTRPGMSVYGTLTSRN